MNVRMNLFDSIAKDVKAKKKNPFLLNIV